MKLIELDAAKLAKRRWRKKMLLWQGEHRPLGQEQLRMEI